MGASHAFGTITRTLHDTSVTSVPSNATQSFPATLPPCPTMPLASAPTHGQGPLSTAPSQRGLGRILRTIVNRVAHGLPCRTRADWGVLNDGVLPSRGTFPGVRGRAGRCLCRRPRCRSPGICGRRAPRARDVFADVWHPFALHSDHTSFLQSTVLHKSTALTQTSSAFASARVHWAQPPKKGPAVLTGGNDGGGGGGGGAAMRRGRAARPWGRPSPRSACTGATRAAVLSCLLLRVERGEHLRRTRRRRLIGESHASGWRPVRSRGPRDLRRRGAVEGAVLPADIAAVADDGAGVGADARQGPLSATPSQAGFGGAGPSSRTIVK